jgi:hypothetical protein
MNRVDLPQVESAVLQSRLADAEAARDAYRTQCLSNQDAVNAAHSLDYKLKQQIVKIREVLVRAEQRSYKTVAHASVVEALELLDKVSQE